MGTFGRACGEVYWSVVCFTYSSGPHQSDALPAYRLLYSRTDDLNISSQYFHDGQFATCRCRSVTIVGVCRCLIVAAVASRRSFYCSSYSSSSTIQTSSIFHLTVVFQHGEVVEGSANHLAFVFCAACGKREKTRQFDGPVVGPSGCPVVRSSGRPDRKPIDRKFVDKVSIRYPRARNGAVTAASVLSLGGVRLIDTLCSSWLSRCTSISVVQPRDIAPFIPERTATVGHGRVLHEPLCCRYPHVDFCNNYSDSRKRIVTLSPQR